MKIRFRCLWVPPGKIGGHAFKNEQMRDLFLEYTKRTSKFTPCEWAGRQREFVKAPSSKLWICDLGPKAKMLSSEDLAKQVGRLANEGTSLLEIWIGPPDGFTPADRERLKPDLMWNFGPLTLPHELAAVVASEQIYRAWTILKNHPYHGGH